MPLFILNRTYYIFVPQYVGRLGVFRIETEDVFSQMFKEEVIDSRLVENAFY